MVRFALQARRGQVDLDAAAIATAQRVETVRAGLKWLATQGQVDIVEEGEKAWRLAKSSAPVDVQGAEAARARLDSLLAETAAYRAYFANAPANVLVQRGTL